MSDRNFYLTDWLAPLSVAASLQVEDPSVRFRAASRAWGVVSPPLLVAGHAAPPCARISLLHSQRPSGGKDTRHAWPLGWEALGVARVCGSRLAAGSAAGLPLRSGMGVEFAPGSGRGFESSACVVSFLLLRFEGAIEDPVLAMRSGSDGGGVVAFAFTFRFFSFVKNSSAIITLLAKESSPVSRSSEMGKSAASSRQPARTPARPPFLAAAFALAASVLAEGRAGSARAAGAAVWRGAVCRGAAAGAR